MVDHFFYLSSGLTIGFFSCLFLPLLLLCFIFSFSPSKIWSFIDRFESNEFLVQRSLTWIVNWNKNIETQYAKENKSLIFITQQYRNVHLTFVQLHWWWSYTPIKVFYSLLLWHFAFCIFMVFIVVRESILYLVRCMYNMNKQLQIQLKIEKKE